MKILQLDIDKLSYYYDGLSLGKEFTKILLVMFIPYLLINFLIKIWFLILFISLEEYKILFIFIIISVLFWYWIVPKIYWLQYFSYLNLMKLEGKAYILEISFYSLFLLSMSFILYDFKSLDFLLSFLGVILFFIMLLKAVFVMRKITPIGQKILSDYWKGYIEEEELEKTLLGISPYFLEYMNVFVRFIVMILLFIIMFFYGLILNMFISILTYNVKFNELPMSIAIILVFSFIIIVLTGLKKHILSISVSKYKKRDTREHIVYLRAFEQDKFFIRHFNFFKNFFLSILGKTKLDFIMLEECSTIGPTIALGDPKDQKSIYGPARYYARDDEWQDYVHKILDEARLIYMFLQGTNGVKWEVEQLVKMNRLKKTIFIIAPKSKQKDVLNYFYMISNSPLVEIDDESKVEIVDKIKQNSVIGFFINDSNEMIVLEAKRRDWTAYLITIRASLRLKIDSESLK